MTSSDAHSARNAAGVKTLAGVVALGGASFSLPEPRDDEAATRAIRVAYDAGIRVFDSARAYAPVGEPLHNEQLLARALAGLPDVVIGTKGGHFRTGVSEWAVDNSPERLRRDVEDSLRALGQQSLGLFYLHRADDLAVPLEESVGALAAMRAEGLIERIGLSNVSLEQLVTAQRVAPIAAVQNPYSGAGTHSTDVLDRAHEEGVAFFAYSPLRGAGDLSLTFPRLSALAIARGTTPQRLFLRGLLASSPALSMVTGASRPTTIRESAEAAGDPWDDEAQVAFVADTTTD